MTLSIIIKLESTRSSQLTLAISKTQVTAAIGLVKLMPVIFLEGIVASLSYGFVTVLIAFLLLSSKTYFRAQTQALQIVRS